ncbi:MAG TPA: TolC family outer membrane protein [Caulobacterales bacterium]|nr:TolC family outer membrane protein [Caulobacterales bacterium]
MAAFVSWRGLCATLSLASLAVAAPAPASALTLEDALQQAFSDNPDLEQARLGVTAANEDRSQAFAAYAPTFDIGGSYGTRNLETFQPNGLFGPVHTENKLAPSTASARVQEELFTGGRRRGHVELARAGVSGARATLRSTEQDVLLSAVQAYLSVWRDQQIVDLNAGYVTSLEREVAGTQRRLEVGEVTRTDLSQAQARLAGARASLASSRSALEGSRAQFIQIIGVQPDDLAPPPSEPTTPDSLDAALLEASNHPRLQAARQNENAAAARIRIERSARLPQLSFVARADRNEDINVMRDYQDSSSASLQFSMPLYDGGYAWSRTHQAEIGLDSARAASEARRRQTEAEVVTRWNAQLAAREVLTAAREQVASAEAAFQGAQREQGLGLRTTIEVLNAEQEWRQAQIDLARAEANEQISAYQLLSASGTLSLDYLESNAR